ncbi:MAG: hypothetical protein JRN20_19540, partial [Nitrososphaerota archaeon]|nr:hypothetical protein [Nitrososphaerota archaeon]
LHNGTTSNKISSSVVEHFATMVILFSRLSLFPSAGSQSTDSAFHDYLNILASALGLISVFAFELQFNVRLDSFFYYFLFQILMRILHEEYCQSFPVFPFAQTNP